MIFLTMRVAQNNNRKPEINRLSACNLTYLVSKLIRIAFSYKD